MPRLTALKIAAAKNQFGGTMEWSEIYRAGS